MEVKMIILLLMLLCFGNLLHGSNLRKDLAIILDCSKSISQSRYESNIHFIDTLLDYMSISPGTTRVALITFSSKAKTEFNFEKFVNRECVRKTVRDLYKRKRGGKTNINAALEKAIHVFRTCRGYKKTKEVYLISDGKWNDGKLPITSVKTLNEMGVKTHVFAVGRSPDIGNLLTLASAPKKTYYTRLTKDCRYQKRIIKILTQRKVSLRACKGNGKVLDECNRECTCVNGVMKDCYRIRKEFTSHTPKEKRRFSKAYLKITTEEPVKSRFIKFIVKHKILFYLGIHYRYQFFPWHRWYVYVFENLLREYDCRITAPVWDWSYWSEVAWKVGPHIWTDDKYGLGGDGTKDKEYCVQTGPFREGVWTHPAPEKKAAILESIYDVTGQCSKKNESHNVTNSCLRRSFNHKPPNLSHVLQTISIPCTKFKKFDKIVRADYHNDIHNSIGGQMSTDYAANTPEFFMHHGMLDSIWYRWQKKDHKCKYAYFPKNISKLMDAHPFTTMDFIDSFNQGRCVKVKYDDWIASKIKPGTNLGDPSSGSAPTSCEDMISSGKRSDFNFLKDEMMKQYALEDEQDEED